MLKIVNNKNTNSEHDISSTDAVHIRKRSDLGS